MPRLVLICWITAFVLAWMPWGMQENLFFAVSITLLCVAGIVSLLQRTAIPAIWGRDQAVIGGALAALWLVAGISMLRSEIPFVSFIYWMFFSAWPLGFLIACRTDFAAKQSQYILPALLSLLALVAAFGISQYLFMQDWLFEGRRVAWPMADPNTLGGLIALGLWLALGGMVAGSTRSARNLSLIAGILLAACLVLTGSRGAMLSFAAVFIVFVWINKSVLRSHLRCLGGLVVAGGLALYVSGFWQILLQQGLLQAGALSERPQIWAAAWKIASAHLWTGTGIGTFFLYYPQYRSGDFHSAGLMAHNDPLQFAAEMGMLAPLLFYGIFLYMLWRTMIAIRNHPTARLTLSLPMMAILGTVIQAHVTQNFYTLPTLLLMGALMGYWVQQMARLYPAAMPRVFPLPDTARQGLAVGMMVMAFAFVSAMGSEILLQQATKALMQGDLPSFAANINTAGRLSMNRNARVLLQAATIPMVILENDGKMMRPAGREKLLRQINGLLDQAQAANPRLPGILNARAQITDDPGQKITLLRQALTLDSLHLPSRTLLADAYEAQHNDKAALDVLIQGLDWPYKQADAVPYLQRTATLALTLGDQQVQEKALRRLWEMQRRRK